MHQISEETGAVDLVMNPANPRELYAAMWTARRLPWTLIDGGEEGGVFKSVDGGDSWSRSPRGCPPGRWAASAWPSPRRARSACGRR